MSLKEVSAHNIESRKIIHERFFVIAQRILNALFFTIEKIVLKFERKCQAKNLKRVMENRPEKSLSEPSDVK